MQIWLLVMGCLYTAEITESASAFFSLVFLIKIRDGTKQPEARGEMKERCLWFRF